MTNIDCTTLPGEFKPSTHVASEIEEHGAQSAAERAFLCFETALLDYEAAAAMAAAASLTNRTRTRDDNAVPARLAAAIAAAREMSELSETEQSDRIYLMTAKLILRVLMRKSSANRDVLLDHAKSVSLLSCLEPQTAAARRANQASIRAFGAAARVVGFLPPCEQRAINARAA